MNKLKIKNKINNSDKNILKISNSLEIKKAKSKRRLMSSVISLTRGDVVLSQLAVFLDEEGRSKEESSTPHGHEGAQQE